MDTIGKRICDARKNKSYTTEQLAVRVGVKSETLKGWEADERDPRAGRLLGLAGALDVTIAWLMVGEDYASEAPDKGRLDMFQAKLVRVKQLHGEIGHLIKSLEVDARIMAAREEEMEQLAEIEQHEAAA